MYFDLNVEVNSNQLLFVHSRLVSAPKKRLFIVCFMVIWIATAALIATSTLCTKSENWNLYRVDNSKKEKILAAIIALLIAAYCSFSELFCHKNIKSLFDLLKQSNQHLAYTLVAFFLTQTVCTYCLFQFNMSFYILNNFTAY